MNEALAQKIYSLQNKIVRELNDVHIFLEQAQPLLFDARARYEGSQTESDRRYYVPSIGKRKFAERTDKELKEIYDRFTSTGLFESFLVRSLSQFESFLADLLIVFLHHYPQRITEVTQGIPACPSVSAKDLMAAQNKEELVRRVLDDHVSNVFRQRPSVYMAYVVKLLSVKNDPSFADYYEVAATRDLVVHNNGKINDLYLEKAGTNARGALGQVIAVDEEYFSAAVAGLKKVSGAIKRDVEKKYGAQAENV